jgi:hypothetical protein
MGSRLKLFQIIYNDLTMKERDVGFAVLDNRENKRPDWYEYWPIREYFKQNKPDDSVHYGFFSPKFFQKTGLKFSDIRPHLTRLGVNDVVVLSPFLDESALFLSQLQQGEAAHPGLISAFATLFPRQGPRLIQTTETTIYCNYFVASGAFWRIWLDLAQRVFDAAETPHSRMSQSLNSSTRHDGTSDVQLKVFCIERLAGWMVADSDRWRSTAPFALTMPIDKPLLQTFRQELIELDHIKKLMASTREYDRYFPAYVSASKSFSERVMIKYRAQRDLSAGAA